MLLLQGIILLAGLTVVSLGAGAWLLRLLRVSDFGGLERIVAAAALGIGSLQAVPFTLLAFGAASPAVFQGTAAILFIAFAPQAIRALRSAWTARVAQPLPWWEKALGVIFLLVLTTVFVRTVLPPTDSDALSYHLTAAKRFLQAERFVFLPSITHTNWPLGIESLYTWLMGLDRGAPVAVVQFLLGMLTLGATWLIAARIGGRAAAAVALTLLLAHDGIWKEMTLAYVDLGTTAFASLAVLSIIRFTAGGDGADRWILLACVFAGLAATSKLNGVWVIVSLTFVVASSSAGSLRMRIFTAVRFAAVAAAVAAPWFLRTWALTGNPLYPAFHRLFGGREWTETGFARLHEFYLRLNVPPGLPPTKAVLEGTHAAIALVAALFALFVFLYTRKARAAIPARFASLLVALVCTFSILNLRFLLAAFPAIAICAAMPVQRISRRGAFVLVVAATLLGYRLGVRKLDPELGVATAVAAGKTDARDYQRQGVLGYELVEYTNANLPASSRIAVSTLANQTALYDATTFWTDYWMQDSVHFDSPGRLRSDLQRLGVTHIVIQTEYDPWCDRSHVCRYRKNVERVMLLDFAREYGRLLLRSPKAELYEVRP